MSGAQKILRFTDLKEAGVPWCRMHIDRLERKGKFPKRVRLGPGTIGWVESEIAAFISNAMNARQMDTSDNKQAA